MKAIILGTGNGSALECYNTCFVLNNNDEYFLVDSGGGNGILKQLKDSNIDLYKIKAMFISHTHADHILGAIWVIRRMLARYYKHDENYTDTLLVYGNDLVIKALDDICKLILPTAFLPLIGDKVKFIEVTNQQVVTILDKKVTFFDLNAVKVKQYGFYIEYDDNKKFSFIGDECCNINTEKYIINSEWLFADAYMAGIEADIYNPIERHHHSTVKYISEIASRLNIKNLILSHTVDTDLKRRKITFIEDSKNYYNGNVYVPDDLDIIDII